MKIRFSKLSIHHFLSFDHAEIDLTDRGYCLVNGVNKNPKDAARSNGSGKSTIANAVAFALIGETISGLKSNLSNIYFDDGCYVELEFFVDSVKYNILRSKEDSRFGTNLKIFVNDEDKSGKGIRESQLILDQLLPDITRELIGSVILLGQGLPDRFTANSPSGRKEVLEHLSKSDFMIQDLKKRIEDRSSVLNNKLREQQDLELSSTTEKSVYEKYLNQSEKDLSNISQAVDFDQEIKIKKDLLEQLNTKYLENESKLNGLKDEKQKLNESLLNETNIKSERLSKVHEQFLTYDKELSQQKSEINFEIRGLSDEVLKLKNIKDICPTCGQKLPDVKKPTPEAISKKESDLEEVKKSLSNLEESIRENNSEYNKVKLDIENKFNENTNYIRTRLQEISRDEVLYSNVSTKLEIDKLNRDILSIEKDRDSYQQRLSDLNNKIKEYKDKISDIDTKLSTIADTKRNISEHIDVINKMNTYIKRDFRGILLTNSINYINRVAKIYSSKIFATDEIEFKLDGNNIDILFCNKDYENLSGGEKQRVDLITQFAIRDMLSKQLGFTSNILFLDEITDNLDAESCEKVINFITNEFKDIESTFIISHHSDLSIPVDTQISVVKDERGVSTIL